jgi:hypothetical protein
VRRARSALATLLAASLAGCGGLSDRLPQGDAETGRPADADERRVARRGVQGSLLDVAGLTGAGNVRLGSGREEALVGAEVNRHLWLASLDTLDFLPISGTDPFTGLISTDWGQVPEAPDERFRVNAYVTSTTLEPRSLRVAVFRQERAGGEWVTLPGSEQTARRIEDAILTRARQLRLAELEQG